MCLFGYWIASPTHYITGENCWDCDNCGIVVSAVRMPLIQPSKLCFYGEEGSFSPFSVVRLRRRSGGASSVGTQEDGIIEDVLNML